MPIATVSSARDRRLAPAAGRASSARRRPSALKLAALAAGVALLAAVGPARGQAQPPVPQPPQPGQPTAPGGQPGGQPGGPGAPGGDQARQWMDQMRKSAEERLKVLLAATDDEYAVLMPKIEKIRQLQAANDPRRIGIGMLMSNSTWRNRPTSPGEGQRQANDAGNRAPEGNQPPRWSPFGAVADTATSQKAKELQEALESKEATDATLKARLDALRAAKQEAKAEIASAQKDLRDVCSVRQEAVLAIMGILD